MTKKKEEIEEVKEVEIVEEKKEKKGSAVGIIVVILLFLLMILGALVIALNNVGLLKIDGLNYKEIASILNKNPKNIFS